MAIQKKHYDIEKQGQCDFFDNYRIDGFRFLYVEDIPINNNAYTL